MSDQKISRESQKILERFLKHLTYVYSGFADENSPPQQRIAIGSLVTAITTHAKASGLITEDFTKNPNGEVHDAAEWEKRFRKFLDIDEGLNTYQTQVITPSQKLVRKVLGEAITTYRSMRLHPIDALVLELNAAAGEDKNAGILRDEFVEALTNFRNALQKNFNIEVPHSNTGEIAADDKLAPSRHFIEMTDAISDFAFEPKVANSFISALNLVLTQAAYNAKTINASFSQVPGASVPLLVHDGSDRSELKKSWEKLCRPTYALAPEHDPNEVLTTADRAHLTTDYSGVHPIYVLRQVIATYAASADADVAAKAKHCDEKIEAFLGSLETAYGITPESKKARTINPKTD